MTLFSAFTILAAIHLSVILFATIFTIMTFFGAFTILTTIHFLISSGFPFIFATTMKFIVSLCCSFKSHIVISNLSYFLLDFCSICRTVFICNSKLF